MNIIKILCLLLLSIYPSIDAKTKPLSKVTYPLKKERIDVVIPCTEKDLLTLDLCISGIRANVQNLGRVLVVSNQKLTDQAEWVPEKIFPFSKRDIAFYLLKDKNVDLNAYLAYEKNRSGWILQQLLKLYSPFVIKDLSSNILVVDADTIFLKPLSFQNEKNGALLNVSSEYHRPYFKHMKALLPDLKRHYSNYSGITHHMLFQKAILVDLIRTIETIHGDKAWKVFCSKIAEEDIFFCGASEYEIYFNFALSRTDQVQIRPLKWINIFTLDVLSQCIDYEMDYVCCHSHMRDLLLKQQEEEKEREMENLSHSDTPIQT